MKSLVLILTVLVNAGMVSVASAQTPGARDQSPDQPPAINLRFAPTLGQYLRIVWSDREVSEQPTMTVDSSADPVHRTLEQNITNKEIAYDWRVLDRDTAGNTEIAIRYEAVKIEITKGRIVRTNLQQIGSEEVLSPGATIVVDTRLAAIESNPALEEMNQRPPENRPPDFAKIVEVIEWTRRILNATLLTHAFNIVVSPTGKVLSVKGMDALIDQYREEMSQRQDAAGMRAQIDQWLEAFFSEEGVTQSMTLSMLLPYPSQPVRPGDFWSDKSEFKIRDIPLEVTRKISLVEAPKSTGPVLLSGTLEIALPKPQGQLSVVSHAKSMRVTARIDAITGMYSTLEFTGAQDPSIHNEAEAREQNYNARTSSRIVATQLGNVDPLNKKLWAFRCGRGRYEVSVGPNWVPGGLNHEIAGMIFSVFLNTVNDAQLTTSSQSSDPHQSDPLDQAPIRLQKNFESSGYRVKLSWSKLFETGTIHWVRFRMELVDSKGKQMVYWSQFGRAPDGYYSFEVTLPSTSTEETDAEIVSMLDAIHVRER